MAHVRSLFVFFALAAIAGCSESHGLGTDAGGHEGHDGDVSPDSFFFPQDAGSPGEDARIVEDANVMPPTCAAEDAHEHLCPATLCDGPDSYAWDGERCIRIDCGACEGADCGHLPHSPAECEAAHASCEPEMCRATGGEWLFWAQECQPYRCGSPQPAECLVGRPVCNCGDHRSWDPARGGCFDDASCPEVDPLPPMQLCTATGGTWMPGICCNTHCGEFCPLACANDACACGPLQDFDPIRGCVDVEACHWRGVGQECDTGVRCQDGLLCCEHCGGAGCDPHMTCTAPVCDSDPNTDVCGNDLLAP